MHTAHVSEGFCRRWHKLVERIEIIIKRISDNSVGGDNTQNTKKASGVYQPWFFDHSFWFIDIVVVVDVVDDDVAVVVVLWMSKAVAATINTA